MNRAAARRDLGTLRDLVVSQRTSDRYTKAVCAFLEFNKGDGGHIPRTFAGLDKALMRWIENLWESGDSKGVATNGIAGCQHLVPGCRNRLSGAWRLLSAWSRHELPARAPPLTLSMVRALAGEFLKQRQPGAASLIMLGFRCFFRPGEMMKVTPSDITVGLKNKTAVVNLGMTKSGIRGGVAESVICRCGDTVNMLAAVCSRRKAHQPLFEGSSAASRGLFARGLHQLNLDEFEFKMYALRRGGGYCCLRGWRQHAVSHGGG